MRKKKDPSITAADPVSARAANRSTLPPFDALRAFDAVARTGGVRKAALELDRDHAAISRHLRTLESWTNSVLFERTSRGTRLTREGQHYHKEISQAINHIARATKALMKQNTASRLNVWSMPGFALYWVTPHLKTFEEDNPGLDIQIRPTNQSPDFLTDEADIDIRFVRDYGEEIKFAPGVKFAELGRAKIIAVASPDYLATHDNITAPEDLLDHYLLHEAHYKPWEKWLAAQGVPEGMTLTGPRLWQSHLTLDSARRGRGVALTNYLVVAEDLTKGDLVEIGVDQPGFTRQNYGIYFFIARASRWNDAAIKRYRQWLQKTISGDLAAIDP